MSRGGCYWAVVDMRRFLFSQTSLQVCGSSCAAVETSSRRHSLAWRALVDLCVWTALFSYCARMLAWTVSAWVSVCVWGGRDT
eukprot:3276994-Prymnesium_polylepis.1